MSVDSTHLSENMKFFCRKLFKMGLLAVPKGNKKVLVMYQEVIRENEIELEGGRKEFTGKTPLDIYTTIIQWVNDKGLWMDSYTLVKFREEYNGEVDLYSEILNLGFKYAEILFEHTNFVEVTLKYCYRDEYGKFRYDGILKVEFIGNKVKTLDYIKNWAENDLSFVPTKNKL